MSQDKPLKKPLLRGYSHQIAFYITIGASAMLIAKVANSSRMVLISSIVYSLGLLLQFGMSALYHRPHWEPRSRAIMESLDLSAIYILIAGTFTPVCLLALSEKDGNQLLIIVWTTAILGIFKSIFWLKAPKAISALFYVIMGWLALPYLDELHEHLGTSKLNLIIAGGVVYSIGAIFYATKKPKLFPTIFGYHELFHLFTIIAATLHFIVIYQLLV